MKIRVNGTEQESSKLVSYIEYGYDRSYKSWCTIAFDEYGCEIESQYDGNQKARDLTIKELSEKYEVNDIRKIKAY